VRRFRQSGARPLLERVARQMTGVGLTLEDDAELGQATPAVRALDADVRLALLDSVDELRRGVLCELACHSSLH
jgi:hypothetical protein